MRMTVVVEAAGFLPDVTQLAGRHAAYAPSINYQDGIVGREKRDYRKRKKEVFEILLPSIRHFDSYRQSYASAIFP